MLLSVKNSKSIAAPEVRQTSCAVGPIPPAAIPVIQQEVFDAAQRVAKKLSRHSSLALRKILKRGKLVTFNPQADGTAQVSLDAIQTIEGGKISVPVARGTAIAVAMLPVDVNLHMIGGGSKNLRNPRTKRLRITITFTLNDGQAFSAVDTFKLKKEAVTR